ncbi:MAG: pentapeptide repeat-containing protein [Cyanobacteria bacterium J06621_8]
MKVTGDRTIDMTEVSNYEQQGNYGVGHMDGGEIKDNAKVAGHLEEKNHDQSNKTDINLTVNIDSQDKSQAKKTLANNSSASNTSKFEITLSGELTKDQRASYKGVEIEIEDLVEKLGKLGIKHKLTINYVKQGSIKIGLEGHPEDFQKLQALFKLEPEQIKEILGIPVEGISLIVDEDFDQEETKKQEKARLIKEIRTKGAQERYLFKANLIRANLIRANLIRANLIRANLIRANLRKANLFLAKLSEAKLIGAYLSGAYLSNADLSNADLSNADLSNADLIGAKLTRANLSGANLIRADLSRANLSGANLSGADLRRADLSETDLSGTDLSGVYLIRADLSGTDLSGADLSGTDLSGADLRKANLSGADLRRADLSGANLSGANLSNADLREADLIRADLSNADLSDAKVENTRFIQSRGIDRSLKLDLIRRGAIFEDSPGDRSRNLSRV